MEPNSVPRLFACHVAGVRFGEARHPGPDSSYLLLNVGISNPGGLQSKEDMVLALGPGIMTMAETQLSAVTIKSYARSFRSGGNKLNRMIRPHFSHPAPLLRLLISDIFTSGTS